MMRRDFYLENGIYCEGLFDDFKLYYNKQELTPSCSNIAYIPNTLIAIKSGTTVYVHKPKIIKVGGKISLYTIARFESRTPNAYLKVKMYDKTYIIDSNVQISLCNCPKLS